MPNPAKISSTPKMHPARSRNGHPLHPANSGRWALPVTSTTDGTAGKEPVLPGHTEEKVSDGASTYRKCLPQATRRSSRLENHWGLTRTPEASCVSPKRSTSAGRPHGHRKFWRTLRQVEKIAPFTTFVQAKTYFGGGEWYTLDLDYPALPRSCPKSATTDTFRSSSKAKPCASKRRAFASGFFLKILWTPTAKASLNFLPAGGGHSSLRLWRQSVDKGNGQIDDLFPKGFFLLFIFLKKGCF